MYISEFTIEVVFVAALTLLFLMKGQSSIDEGPLEQEEEVLKLQRQKAKSLTIEDFGLEDINEDGGDERGESDGELTLEVRVQFSPCQWKGNYNDELDKPLVLVLCSLFIFLIGRFIPSFTFVDNFIVCYFERDIWTINSFEWHLAVSIIN